jgi:uncharacterized protein
MKKRTSRLKTSRYNVLAECEDGMLLYNQISGGLLLLDESEFAEYRKAESGDFGIERGLLNALKLGMHVTERKFDEIAWMHEVFVKKSGSHTNKGLTIAPTDRCNLDCGYCYEAKDQWVLMPDEVVKKVKAFTRVFVSHTPTKTLGITWFGGEPTLHIEAIEEISSHAADLANEFGFSLGQNMITNGTTLNSRMRDRLSKIGVKKLQITVDGLKEDHDKKRPYRESMAVADNRLKVLQERPNGCGGCSSNSSHKRSSFDKIMEHLPALHAEGFTVSVRVNLNEENIDSFQELQRSLTKYESINVYPARINGCEQANLSKEKFSIIERSVLAPFSGTSCMASQTYNLGISQNGRVSKCWEHITNEEHTVGDVGDFDLARSGFVDDYSPAKDPDCSSCPVLPSCWGGCRAYNKFFEQGYIAKNYDGCSFAKWNIREKILKMYRDAKSK